MTRIILRAAAIIVAAALFIPLFATAEAAPVASFTTAGTYEVFQSIAFNATASTGDGDLEYEWDFDAADGIQVDATGAVTAHAFTAPGIYTVTLLVRDSEGAEATVTKTVNIDDFITVKLTLLDTPDRTTATLARLDAQNWNGAGLDGVVVKVGVFYRPTSLDTARLIRSIDIVTGEDGSAIFPIPRDTFAGNLVGGHFATAFVSIPTSFNGNVESAADRVDYAIGA